jgi:hypothetical protein
MDVGAISASLCPCDSDACRCDLLMRVGRTSAGRCDLPFVCRCDPSVACPCDSDGRRCDLRFALSVRSRCRASVRSCARRSVRSRLAGRCDPSDARPCDSDACRCDPPHIGRWIFASLCRGDPAVRRCDPAHAGRCDLGSLVDAIRLTPVGAMPSHAGRCRNCRFGCSSSTQIQLFSGVPWSDFERCERAHSMLMSAACLAPAISRSC